jgi:hypothetical protein
MKRVVGVVEGDENLADGEVHEGAVADAPGVAGDSVLVRDVSGASFDETARLAEDSRSAREDFLLDGDYFFLELDDCVGRPRTRETARARCPGSRWRVARRHGCSLFSPP